MSEFTNAQAMAKLHPATFEAPAPDDLLAIKPGDYVKICATSENGGERFWVEVTAVEGERLAGVVENVIVDPDLELQYGDCIQFERRHIYDVREGNDG